MGGVGARRCRSISWCPGAGDQAAAAARPLRAAPRWRALRCYTQARCGWPALSCWRHPWALACAVIKQTKADRGVWCDRCKRSCLAVGGICKWVPDVCENRLGSSYLREGVRQSPLPAGGRFPYAGATSQHAAVRAVGWGSAHPCCSVSGPGWQVLAGLSTWSASARVAGVLPGCLLVDTISRATAASPCEPRKHWRS